MIVGDIFLNSGWGLIAPIFAIFILKNVAVGDAAEGMKIAGFATLTYWLVKSLLQIPIGRYLDKKQGERDDYWFMVAGLFLAGLAPFGFILSSLAWHIYFFEAIHGIGMALAVVAWSAIFTRHIDKGREALTWSLESTGLGLAAGIAGAVGGVLATFVGFQVILAAVGGLTIFSALLLLLIRKQIVWNSKVGVAITRSGLVL